MIPTRISPAHVAHVVWDHGAWAAGELVRRGRPRHLVHFYGRTPGDDLMCTAALREMRVRGFKRVWMMSRFPELFDRNPDVDRVVPFDERYRAMTTWLGGRSWYAHYGGHDHETDRSPQPERHIIAQICQSCGVDGTVTLRPYLHLTDEERAAGRIGPNVIALHSSGQSAYSSMKNKEWRPGRFQSVVKALQGEFTFVQLGSPDDERLEGSIDMRGRTTMRESAAIIANSRLFLGQVGFLMHLTRAVDRPAVIVYGGREMPWQSGYSCNTNLATPLPCAPCWRWNACDHPIERQCMRLIGVDEVVHAVRERAARAEEPLTEDTDTIPIRAD